MSSQGPPEGSIQPGGDELQDGSERDRPIQEQELRIPKVVLETQRSIQEEETQSEGLQDVSQNETNEFANLVNEEKADYDMYGSELSTYRRKFEQKYAELSLMLQSKLEEEQIPIAESGLKRLEDLMGKIRFASDFVNRSPCANSSVRAGERKARSEMVSRFEDIADEADIAIRAVKSTGGGTVKSRTMERRILEQLGS